VKPHQWEGEEEEEDSEEKGSSICLQSVPRWKRFTDYFSWGKRRERERENNLIQEIPRQTKTELLK